MEIFEHMALDLEQLLSGEKSANAVKRSEPIVLAVGGGQGVGKTLVAVLLSIELAKRGHETLLVDADFSGAGLYQNWQQPDLEKKILHYLKGTQSRIEKLALPTECRRLRVFSGAQNIGENHRLALELKIRLYKNLGNLPMRYVVIDLGSGAVFRHLDFFIKADYPILLANCDKTSLLATYHLLRTAVVRKVEKAEQQWPDLYKRLQKCGDLGKKLSLATVAAFLKQSARKDSRFKEYIEKQLQKFQPSLILNKVHSEEKCEKAGLLPIITAHMLNVELVRRGNIRYDEQIARMENVDLLKGNLPAYLDAAEIVKKMLC